MATTAGTPKARDVLDLLGEVGRAGPDPVHVLGGERRVERLAGHDLADAAVHLEGADGGHDAGRVRVGGPRSGT